MTVKYPRFWMTARQPTLVEIGLRENAAMSPGYTTKMLQGSLDVIDGAAILREAAISMRHSAAELDRLANQLDAPHDSLAEARGESPSPQPEQNTPKSQTTGA